MAPRQFAPPPVTDTIFDPPLLDIDGLGTGRPNGAVAKDIEADDDVVGMQKEIYSTRRRAVAVQVRQLLRRLC
jgi:hypothetical protein